MSHRYAARIDTTHRAIVAALRAAGCSVLVLSAKEVGTPDILVGRNRRTWLAELKSDAGELRPSQVAWHARWRGEPVHVWRSADDALRAVGAM